MSDERRRMRLGDTRRIWRTRPFRIDRGVRRLRSRNDTEYVLSNPEWARRLDAALERSIERERYWRSRRRLSDDLHDAD